MATLINQRLLSKNDVIVVAVSGGIDSMVLLDLLCRLRTSLKLTIIVAHVNHGVREASVEEFEFVKAKAEAYHVPFEGIRLDPLPHTHFHEEARKRRYAFFLSVADKYRANKIALAHHADDQAETLLMRLTRGSSFKGYGGILESIREGDITYIRPLLNTTKKAIEAYQEEHGIGYRHDASNDADDYTRNRFRHHVMPAIEKESKPYRQKLNQFSKYMWEANDLISRLSDQFIREYTHNLDQTLQFSVAAFNHLDLIVRRDVLKKVFDTVAQDQHELSFIQSNELLKIIESPKPHASVSLADHITVSKSYDILEIKRLNEEPNALPTLVINGFGSWTFGTDGFTVTKDLPNIIDGICLELWYNNLDLIFPLSVRRRIDGDKIKIGNGTQKIKDLFIDLKVPMTKRDSLPLVVNSLGEVLWIPGIKISSSTKIGDNKLYVVYKRGSSC